MLTRRGEVEAFVEYEMVQLLREFVSWFFKKVVVELPHDPVIIAGIDPEKLKAGIQGDTWTCTLAALFTTAKMQTNRGAHQQTDRQADVVHPYCGLLFSPKKGSNSG